MERPKARSPIVGWPAPVPRRVGEKELRLGAGLVLFTFVTMHLLNHALGVFGVHVLEAVQTWRVWLWRTWPGTILLYGAATLHVSLALKRIALRRTWHMPAEEALQIALGLTIPLLVLDHALGTRYSSSNLGTDDTYRYVLQFIWTNKPVMQTLLVLVAWFHGIIGIHYVFRSQPWFGRVRVPGAILAFSIPLLSIAGYVAASREVAALNMPAATLSPAQADALGSATQIAWMLLYTVLAALAAVVVTLAIVRRLTHTITVRYVGHGEITLRPGSTLLEASRENRIPHPSLCGGRGRCSTCRVLVVSGLESLPEPSLTERRMLAKISAPASVRLACQLRPRHDLGVQILLPVVAREGGLDWEEETYKWGVDRNVTVLFVDIRAFTTLSKKQLPHDTVLLVNRFVAEATQAVEAHDGKVGMFLSDGLMAIFGLGGQRGMGSRDAIAAGLDMLKTTQALNQEFGSALPMPLRIGIGIHCGPAVIARIGDNVRGYMITALGETVSIASRLESATKELLADMIVSDAALKASASLLRGSMPREVQVRGREQPIKVHALTEPEALEPAA